MHLFHKDFRVDVVKEALWMFLDAVETKMEVPKCA